MLQLIYTSHARVPLTAAEVSRMLLKARVNNELLEVTGMLVYRQGAFMQLLEGEDEAVEGLFATIAADPRHCAVQVLRRSHIDNRTFPGWSMGFLHFERGHADEPVELAEFFDKKGKPTPQSGALALQLLSEFRFGPLRRLVERGFAPAVVR